MKDIKAILNDYEIPEEAREAIAKEVRANYKTVADWQKKADRIAELEEANAALTEKAAALKDGSDEAEALRQQVADLRAAEAERKAEAEAAAQRDAFKKSFDEALGGRRFANEIVAEAVFTRAYERCKSAPGFDVKEAIDEAAGGADGIWVNPQRDPAKMPTQADVSSGETRTHEENAFLAALFGSRADS